MKDGRHTQNHQLRGMLGRWGEFMAMEPPRVLEVMMGGMPPGMDPTEIGSYVASLEQPDGEQYKARLVRAFAILDSGSSVTSIVGDPAEVQHVSYQDPGDQEPERICEFSFVKLDGDWCFGAPVPWRDPTFGAELKPVK